MIVSSSTVSCRIGGQFKRKLRSDPIAPESIPFIERRLPCQSASVPALVTHALRSGPTIVARVRVRAAGVLGGAALAVTPAREHSADERGNQRLHPGDRAVEPRHEA